MSVDLLCVSPSQVPEFWPHVEPLLRRAVEQCGQWSLSEVRHQLDKGALLWIASEGGVVRAACVTRIVLEPAGRTLEAVACGGEGQDWRRLYEDIEDYGRNEGCVISRVSGREGWKRVFNDYDLKWIVLEKRLDQ